MTSSDLRDAETAERYDDSSAFMFARDDLDPAIAFLAVLAADSPVLELAAGTDELQYRSPKRGISMTGVEP